MLDFYCRCKPEDFLRSMRAMDPNSFDRTITMLRETAAEKRGKVAENPKAALTAEDIDLFSQVHCQFCNSPYEVTTKDLEELRAHIDTKRAKSS